MLAVALLYGVNYFTLKALLSEHHNNFAIVALRVLVGVAVFIPYQKLVVKERIRGRADWLRLAACALFGIVINQELFIWGLANTEKVNAAVLMISTPVFVFLGVWLLGEERLTAKRLGGLALSFAGSLGLILLNYEGGLRFSTETLFGDMLITLNAASYGIYLVIVRPLVVKYNTFTIMAWMFLLGLGPTLALGGVPLSGFHWTQMSGSAVFGLVFLILGATLAAYFLNAWSMKHVPSSAVGIYIFVQPVFVAAGSAILETGSFSWIKAGFMLLIFAGVYLTAFSRNTKFTEK